MRVRIITFGDAERVAAKLRTSGRQALNTIAVNEEIATDMLRIEGVVFSSNGRRGGGSWKQLSPSTVRRKGGSTKILRDTDSLFSSLTIRGAPFQVLRISNSTIEFGTDRLGAAFHQEGSRHEPARPFMRFLPSDIARWEQMYARHIVKPFLV